MKANGNKLMSMRGIKNQFSIGHPHCSKLIEEFWKRGLEDGKYTECKTVQEFQKIYCVKRQKSKQKRKGSKK